MLQILYKGIQYNAAMDMTGFNGDVAHDAALPIVTEKVAGRLGSLNPADGTLQLADGATDQPLGFIINDASGYFFENKPAIASGIIPVTFGNCVVITDQIDTDLTFSPGEALYAGTGAKVGLVTNVPSAPTDKKIGIAGSSASISAPELTVLASA